MHDRNNIANSEIEQWVSKFSLAAEIAGIKTDKKQIELEILRAPHKPPSKLPSDKMAVYIFMLGDQCLKVGKAGPKSQARYTSQHYGFNAPSTLAKSLAMDKARLNIASLNDNEIGNWIKTTTDRFNILIDRELGADVLNFLEAFMQCALKPKYEGFKSQRSEA